MKISDIYSLILLLIAVLFCGHTSAAREPNNNKDDDEIIEATAPSASTLGSRSGHNEKSGIVENHMSPHVPGSGDSNAVGVNNIPPSILPFTDEGAGSFSSDGEKIALRTHTWVPEEDQHNDEEGAAFRMMSRLNGDIGMADVSQDDDDEETTMRWWASLLLDGRRPRGPMDPPVFDYKAGSFKRLLFREAARFAGLRLEKFVKKKFAERKKRRRLATKDFNGGEATAEVHKPPEDDLAETIVKPGGGGTTVTRTQHPTKKKTLSGFFYRGSNDGGRNSRAEYDRQQRIRENWVRSKVPWASFLRVRRQV